MKSTLIQIGIVIVHALTKLAIALSIIGAATTIRLMELQQSERK